MKNSKYISVLTCTIIAAFAFLLPACKKNEQAISNVPAITFDSISPNPATRYQDTIKIVITYKDGDGDLGQDSTDAKNLFITDSRNNVTSQFRIPQLTPTGSNIAIEGNIDIVLPPQFFTNDADSSETATFSIYVIDRAGHQSNTVSTAPLVIKK